MLFELVAVLIVLIIVVGYVVARILIFVGAIYLAVLALRAFGVAI